MTKFFRTQEEAEAYAASVLGAWVAPTPGIPASWMVIHP